MTMSKTGDSIGKFVTQHPELQHPELQHPELQHPEDQDPEDQKPSRPSRIRFPFAQSRRSDVKTGRA